MGGSLEGLIVALPFGPAPNQARTGAFQERGGFPAATQMIEQGRKEIARLMREWEDSTKVAGEQEAEVRE